MPQKTPAEIGHGLTSELSQSEAIIGVVRNTKLRGQAR